MVKIMSKGKWTMAKPLSLLRVALGVAILFMSIRQFRVEVLPASKPLQEGESSNDEEPQDDSALEYGPMIELLRLAGESVDDETLNILPSWSKVTSVIGSTEPLIYGLNQCPSFDKEEMILAVAGMFNSGTNNLYQLLKLNCEIRSAKFFDKKVREQRLRVRWQTPWGKHELAETSKEIDETTTPNPTYLDNHWSPKTILPVVTIRDPYTWMQSMCRKRYRADWFVSDFHCPNLVENTMASQRNKRSHKGFKFPFYATGFAHRIPVPVMIRYKSFNTTYTSLAHLWNEWYKSYFNADLPFLLVRAEDLIFFPEQVTRQVCECAGGVMKEKFTLSQEDLKKKHFLFAAKTTSKESRDMAAMIVRYGAGGNRTRQMTQKDLDYATMHLDNVMMEMNEYQHPEALEVVTPGVPVIESVARVESKSHQPLLDLLYLGGEKVSNQTLQEIPTWANVTNFIGSTKPIILGLAQCASLDKNEAILAIGGLFNTESNKLFQLLNANCDIKSKKYVNKLKQPQRRLREQLPWGKYDPARMRTGLIARIKSGARSPYLDNNWSLDKILPVITIRDPYTWMQSVCHNSVYHKLDTFFTNQHCPSLVPTKTDAEAYSLMKSRTYVRNPNQREDKIRILSGTLDDAGFIPDGDHVPVRVPYSSFNTTYDSIADLWSDWYGAYLKASFPKLFVRAEDILFFPEQVTRQVCECAGGKMRSKFTLPNREMAMVSRMVKFGTANKRTRQLTNEDLEYAKETLDSDLMRLHRYEHPEELAIETNTEVPILKRPVRKIVQRKVKNIKLSVSTVGKEPLIALLRDAGEYVTDADVKRLPMWSQVTSLIGDKPKIYGLQHCSSFNQSEAILAIAGMLNSGTNLMYILLRENCDIFSSTYIDMKGFAERRVRWQVNWGKHELPKFRDVHDTVQDFNYDYRDILPVVTARDPYSWMQSTCRKPYVARWFYTDRHCPNLIMTQEDWQALARYKTWKKELKVKKRLKFQQVPGKPRVVGGLSKFGAPIPTNDTVPLRMHFHSVNMTFTTIADMWNLYYREYLADEHPALFLRAEDLIFFPKEVTKSVCECAGGTIHDMNNFKYVTKALKTEASQTSPTKYTMVDLLVRYGSIEKRTTQMTKEDLAYAKKILDANVMKYYGYHHPDEVPVQP